MEINGKWVTLNNGVHVFIKNGQTLPDAIKEKLNGNRPLDDKPEILKGYIFNSKHKITENSFTDFIGPDFAKLSEDTYMYFWSDSRPHDEIAMMLDSGFNATNKESFRTSVDYRGELDMYDIDALKIYKQFIPEIEEKAKNIFGVHRINRR